MIDVLFFARIREQLGVEKLSVPLSTDSSNLSSLMQYLIKSNDEKWSQILGDDNVIKAVNQEVVTHNCDLNDGDEVAFFPPVTGG